MAKVALLIGVSEYGVGLTKLPVAIKDVAAMQILMQNSEIGGFNEVKPLPNPERQAMEEAIENLFRDRHKDDLVLLFFSGHGIKDESGKLYFATRNTRKTDKGELVKATAVPASFVHEVMSSSRCRHQVVILDCCFSGAFAEGMSARNDGFVDIKNQLFLGKEGRAVLTSSTSTQYSFEQQGAELSTYTQYIVEGLETGVADRDSDGWISVDELHEYAQRKVQEAAPAMNPQIYAIKEGYKIQLAKAPTNDSKLKYRREVEYWARDGVIPEIGRITLDELRGNLKLTPEETAAIEAEVLKPYKEYERKLQRYEQAFLGAIDLDLSVNAKTRADLIRLQRVSGLRDEDTALIETRIIAEKQGVANREEVNIPITGNRQFQYIKMLLVAIFGVVIGGSAVYYLNITSKTTADYCANEQHSFSDKISLGEKILVQQDTNPDKKAGVQAFTKGECKTAIDKFNAYWKVNRNDPEALIYLNNAKARQQVDHLTIAVSVPIGSNQNVANEILRGVAQAQDEVNRNNGINGKLLQVAIANDNNDPTEAVQRANEFVKDASILAVVGHNASNASIAAAPVYQQNGLVLISPTSYAENFSGISSFFRTAPSVSLMANRLSAYAIQTFGKTNFLICLDSNTIDGKAFNDEFVKAIKKADGKINSTSCDLSVDGLKADAIISQAISSGANILFLYPYVDKIEKAIYFAKAANQRRLPIFGNPTLYTYETLQKGKGDVNGMVLPTSWHPKAFPGNPFSKNAQQLWGGVVSWRTATAYDATLAIAKGLQQTKTRIELQKVLHSSNFSVDGATGKIQFSSSGDRRDNTIFLIRVQPKSGNNTDYEFGLLKP